MTRNVDKEILPIVVLARGAMVTGFRLVIQGCYSSKRVLGSEVVRVEQTKKAAQTKDRLFLHESLGL